MNIQQTVVSFKLKYYNWNYKFNKIIENKWKKSVRS